MVSTIALADAPQAPISAHNQTSLTSGKGIWVDEIPISTRAKIVEAVFGSDLELREDRIDVSQPINNLLISGENESSVAGFHDGLVVYLHYGRETLGTNDLYWVDLFAGTSGNASQMAGEEFEPALFDGIAAWRNGSDVYMADLFGGTGPHLVGAGAQPDVGQSVIVMTDGDLQVFNLQSQTMDTYPSGHGTVSWPSVGGDLIAYNVPSGVALRRLTAMNTEEVLVGPCTIHSDPRVNRTGRLVLHAGKGCPSGKDGIFVTRINATGGQEVYKVADLPSLIIPVRLTYSIADKSVGYLDANGSISYVELNL